MGFFSTWGSKKTRQPTISRFGDFCGLCTTKEKNIYVIPDPQHRNKIYSKDSRRKKKISPFYLHYIYERKRYLQYTLILNLSQQYCPKIIVNFKRKINNQSRATQKSVGPFLKAAKGGGGDQKLLRVALIGVLGDTTDKLVFPPERKTFLRVSDPFLLSNKIGSSNLATH